MNAYPLKGNAIALHAQPAIGSLYVLLMRGYLHDELSVDLYGYEADEEGECDVQDVTIAGSLVSIGALVPRADLVTMSGFVSRALLARNKAHNEQMRIDRFADSRVAA